jgi:type II secretory pathway component GspD/PulD (secretin)
MKRLTGVSALLLAIALLSGCAAGRAFRRGEGRARAGDWDAAVTYYREAVQKDPNRPEYRIELERAMLAASRAHFDTARQLELKDQLDAAVLEYRRTTEFDPSNRQAIEKVIQLDKLIRDRVEAARPRPQIAQMREQAQLAGAAPLLNPASREPIRVQFNQASLRDILTFIGNASGINITYDATFQDRPFSINIVEPLEQALNAVLTANGLFYSVLDEHTIIVAQDTNPNRLKYERQVIVTFPVSYADATELATMITTITRTTTAAVPPVITPNKTPNTITVRATQAVMDVIRQLIVTNDKPRAEITVDVEILEVNRTRAKQYGLNLSQYQVGSIFSPEIAPPGSAGAAAATGTTATTADDRPFNLNTISQGINTADFYFAVPQAIVKFLETDSETKILAKPQLRGSESNKMTFKVGTDEPYVTTTYTPFATGGANVNPLSAVSTRTVGITVEITSRVTDEGDILLDVNLESSARGEDRKITSTQTAPSFVTRNLTTRLRLREGESNLLAGLLRDDDRRTLTGFPGLIRIPILKELFASNDNSISQSDIVMLLTPRIVRTHEYTARDLSPIYVGTNQNFGLTGPPPLIAAPPETPETPQPQTPPAPAIQGLPPQGTPVPTVPPSGPPGQVTPQAAPAPGVAPVQTAVQPLAEPQRDLTAPQPSPTIVPPPAQVTVTGPVGDVRVAGGPYMVPVFISGASRLSTITVTVSFNPAALRVRTIQEGSFLRQGGTPATFTNKVDSTIGRIDLTFVRTGDTVGASGSGLLAGILFDAVGTGTSQLNVSGVATDPSGSTIPVQFVPASVVVR